MPYLFVDNPRHTSSYSLIHEVQCTTSSKDPYGTISGGKIRLTAPFLTIEEISPNHGEAVKHSGHQYHTTSVLDMHEIELNWDPLDAKDRFRNRAPTQLDPGDEELSDDTESTRDSLCIHGPRPPTPPGTRSPLRFKLKEHDFRKLGTALDFDYPLDLTADEPLCWLFLSGGVNLSWPESGPPIGLEQYPSIVEGLILRRVKGSATDDGAELFERVDKFAMYGLGFLHDDHDACFRLMRVLERSENRIVTIV